MRWIDCFTELIAYTDYFLKRAPLPPLSSESAMGNFRQLISRAEGMAGAMGLDGTAFREAFFPVCVWIDERVLCSDWPDKEKWAEKPLQKEYFDTTHGGEEFFARLEAVDEKADGLREIYACCLAMGFKGRYYLASDQKHLEEIKAGNLKNILSDTDTEPGEALFPESYRQEPGLKPADKRKPWRRLSAFSVIAFLVPIALFALAYTLSNRMLDRAMEDRFGIRAPASAGKPAEAQAADPWLKSDPKDRSVAVSHHKPAGHTRQEYTVRQGDTLTGIAASIYGNPLRWVSLYRHNREAMEKWEKEPGFPEKRRDRQRCL
jgi:type VI secretion system protein ImpK